MIQDFDRLAPVMAIMLTAGIIFIVDMIVRREDKRLLGGIAILGLAVSAAWLVSLILRDRQSSYFSDSMALDNFSIFFTFMFIGVTAAVILASWDYMERFGERQGEFLALVLIATSGMMLLCGARDLIAIFVALELTSITQFILAGYLRDDKGSEAAIKYLLLGAVSSAVVLYGMAFLFGISGTTRLISTDGSPSIAAAIASGDDGMRSALIVSMVFLAAGFGFKMAIVPFQMWTPDVYQASPTPVAAFLSVGSKAAAFAVVIRLFYEGFGPDTFVGNDWKILFAALAAVTMTVGNVMAMRQTNIRRLLGYSSIAQAGNFLVGLAAISATADGQSQLGASGVVFFLATYAFTNLGAFFAVMAISNKTNSDEIADYAGMGRRAPSPPSSSSSASCPSPACRPPPASSPSSTSSTPPSRPISFGWSSSPCSTPSCPPSTTWVSPARCTSPRPTASPTSARRRCPKPSSSSPPPVWWCSASTLSPSSRPPSAPPTSSPDGYRS